MNNKKIKVGTKRNGLTLLYRKKGSKRIFVCKCDCGETVEIRGCKFGITKACKKCFRKRARKHKGYKEISSSFFSSIKRNARVRGLEFNLKIEYLWDLFLLQGRKCAITGQKLYFKNYGSKSNTASLDRIDSTKGYNKSNVQWLHKDVNKLKMDFSQDFIINFANSVYNRFQNISLDYCDILIKPQPSEINSRKEVDTINTIITPVSQQTLSAFPVMSANMTKVSTLDMARVLAKNKFMCCLHKFYNTNQLIKFFKESEEHQKYCFISCGLDDVEIEKIHHLYNKAGVNKIVLDIANGYVDIFCKFVKKIRKEFQKHIIFAGNVCTPEGCKRLLDSGADGVKLGIGSGALCTTRIVAGVGLPMVTAIDSSVDMIRDYNAVLIADGGINEIGDIPKSIACGSDIVMIGSLFSGHNECVSEDERKTGRAVVYGMSSHYAQSEHFGGKREYRASEGRVIEIDTKGPIQGLLYEIEGGVRSAMSYSNSKNIKDFQDKSVLVKILRTHNQSVSSYTIGK